ncbi:MAG: integrase catalytic subunit [uncultured bacterium]|nr:MAG: integrase catalytic subunit [uncultured bacterium]
MTEIIPRVRGEYKYFIQYRHIIEWLVRKPGAFENYRYRDALYPTSYFRMAYDILCGKMSLKKATTEYLKILHLAARESETKVNESLKQLITNNQDVQYKLVEDMVTLNDGIMKIPDVNIEEIKAASYDTLLMCQEA